MIQLNELDGTNGFVVNGAADRNFSGEAVAGIGDFNGDGIDDFLIGAGAADRTGANGELIEDVGAAYVVFGRDSGMPASVDLDALDANTGLVLTGIDSRDDAGGVVSAAGDINGDGLADIVIGANRSVANDDPDRSEAYVIFGTRTGSDEALDLADLDGTVGFRILGPAAPASGAFARETGVDLASAGDVNDDGIDDFVIGFPGRSDQDTEETGSGRAYVLFGDEGGFAATVDLLALDGSAGFSMSGGRGAGGVGVSVGGGGDVNGDGIDDLVVLSTTVSTPPGFAETGRVRGGAHVIFGSEDGFGANVDLSTLADDGAGFLLFSPDILLNEVANLADIDGDGLAEIVIGAPFSSPDDVFFAGQAVVVFGNPTPAPVVDMSSLNAAQGFFVQGTTGEDQLGSDVATGGDFNGDGFGDILIIAPEARAAVRESVGKIYVVFGGPDGFENALTPADLTGKVGLAIDGPVLAFFDQLAVSFAGDVNDDGIDDILIGSAGASPDGTAGRGQTFVVLGSADWGTDDDGINDRPTALPAAFTTAQGEVLTGQLLARDPDGDQLTYSLLTPPLGGNAVVEMNGSFTYSADQNFVGIDRFGFRVSDPAEANGFASVEVRVERDVDGDGDTPTIEGASGDDFLKGTSGEDLIDGGLGNDTLLGLGENDELVGGEGEDSLRGLHGDDLLFGGQGFDILIGGTGDDTLNGGAGHDIFAFAENHGNDTITDFGSFDGADDVIMLFGSADYSLSGNEAGTLLTFGQTTIFLDFGFITDEQIFVIPPETLA